MFKFTNVHVERARCAQDVWEYCGKEDTRVAGPLEFGVPPARQNVKGSVAERNKMIFEKGVIKAVDDGVIPLEKLK